MTSVSPKDRLDAIGILQLPDDDAVRWLKQHLRPGVSPFFSNPEEELHRVVSFAFSRRGSKRVRQAVARYGSHPRTLKKLFHDGTRSERLGVLSNPFIGPQEEHGLFRSVNVLRDADAKSVLQTYESNARELGVFASNPHINREWLAETITSWVKSSNDDGLLMFMYFLADNPILSARRDETLMDGWADHSFKRLNFALADLLQTAPVTSDWCNVLSRMLVNLYIPYVPRFEIDLIERWKDPEPTDNGERFSFLDLREQITRSLIIPAHDSKVKAKYTLDHSDLAVRKGFYSALLPDELFKSISRSHDFSYPSFRYLDGHLSESQQQFMDLFKEYFERDKNDFVESLIWNDNFWRSKEERGFLNDVAWNVAEDPHSSMNVPNLYKGREQYHLEHNSSFFKDDEFVNIPFEDTVDGKLSKLQDELTKLKEAIQSQSLEDLAQQQRSHFESINKNDQYQIRCLSDKVSEKTDKLARTIAEESLVQPFQALEIRIRRQGRLIWLVIVMIVVVGLVAMN